MATKIKKEVKIGIIFVVGLFLLFAGIKFLKGINIFSSSKHYTVRFHNVEGLTISTPVQINGYKVGMVSSMHVNLDNYQEIIVGVTMDNKIYIPKNAKFILDVSILGTAAIQLEIPPHSQNKTLEASAADTLQGVVAEDILASVQKELMPQFINLLPKIDSILVGMQQVVNDPSLVKATQHAEQVAQNLVSITSQVNTLLSGVNQQLPSIVNNLNQISSNLATTTEQLSEIELKEMMAQVDQALQQVNQVMQQLNTADNNVGLLLNDRELYDNINQSVKEVSLLLEDLRNNPKKYINLKVF